MFLSFSSEAMKVAIAVAVAVAANGLGGFFVCVEGGRRGLCM